MLADVHHLGDIARLRTRDRLSLFVLRVHILNLDFALRFEAQGVGRRVSDLELPGEERTKQKETPRKKIENLLQ